MSDMAISVDTISKQYRIGRVLGRYKTLRDTIVEAFFSPIRKARKIMSGEAGSASGLDETIWALKDVSFEIKQGEVVGIIGRNGSGKSTLLKILSRITEPTIGMAKIHGRVGSLLEVGTGFHPELTGRDNIYLNGAILGMKRVEINTKFDEIVSFAEVEKFIDTPVKHYSSGMYLRLAFAVAAHLEPEILLIDEVLAVGDSRFQKKCLSKMQDVGKQGRTVLFVSHNMSAVTRLCDRSILLEEGNVAIDGPSDKVVNKYLTARIDTAAVRKWTDLRKAPGDNVVRLLSVRVRDTENKTTGTVDIRKPVGIDMEYEVLENGRVLIPYLNAFNEEDLLVFTAIDQDPSWRGKPRPAGRYLSTAWIPGNFLSEGMLLIAAAMLPFDHYNHHFYERNAVAFHVYDSRDGDSARGDWAGNMGGVVRPLLEWHTEFTPDRH